MIADDDGEKTVYDCTDRIFINGKTYRYAEDAIDVIPTGAFAEFFLKDGEISALYIESLTEGFAFECDFFDDCFNVFIINDKKGKTVGNLYCAIYDSENKLKSCQKQTFKTNAFSYEMAYFDINSDDISKEDYVKIFAWDNNLRPMTDCFFSKINPSDL